MNYRLRTERFQLKTWQRVVAVLVGVFVLFMLGTAIGYSVLGDGPVKEVFTFQPLLHIREIIHSK